MNIDVNIEQTKKYISSVSLLLEGKSKKAYVLTFGCQQNEAGFREVPGIYQGFPGSSSCFDRYRTQDLVKGVMLSKRADEVALYTGNDDHIVMDLITPFYHDGKQKYFVGGLLGQWSVWTNRAVEIFST